MDNVYGMSIWANRNNRAYMARQGSFAGLGQNYVDAANAGAWETPSAPTAPKPFWQEATPGSEVDANGIPYYLAARQEGDSSWSFLSTMKDAITNWSSPGMPEAEGMPTGRTGMRTEDMVGLAIGGVLLVGLLAFGYAVLSKPVENRTVRA